MCTLSFESSAGGSLRPVSQPFMLNRVMPMPVSQPGVIRSKYRGLSWDKKHQGWRVRIYWSGKQRHVGRFDDDVAAARAYDKAAVYLYGSNAITNFGLDACQMDLTEVSPFIVLAREQAQQEQLLLNQQRQHCTSLPHLMLSSGMATNGYTLQQEGYLPHQQQQQQQLLQQQQAYLPQQQQQQQQAANVLLMVTPQADPLNMGAACGWSAAAAAGNSMQGSAYIYSQGANIGAMTHRMYHPGIAHQQQQQQVWTPAPGGLSTLPQHHGSQAQTRLPLTAAGYNPTQDRVDPGALGQYAGGYVLSTAAQGMQGGVLAAPASAAAGAAPPVSLPLPASGPQLLIAQQQQQQMMLMAAAAASNTSVAVGNLAPAMSQAQLAHVAASVAMPHVTPSLAGAVSAAPAAGNAWLQPGSTDLVLQHGPAQAASTAATTDAALACGSIGGPSFVQDMLQSLRYAAVGTQQPAVLAHEQRVLAQPQNVNWAEDGGGAQHAAAAAASAAPSQWVLAQHTTPLAVP